MVNQAHQLIEGAVVPWPDGVMAAARLQYLGRVDELPLRAAETVVPGPGSRLPSRSRSAAGPLPRTSRYA
ncbi:hypothetical protein ACF1BU_34575 [Streptomyces sp. NPDC014724]|uniref:hypothetical protein n=1 Tax=unclassified Streptomyces TaxID=2593676 RepID=UPI00370331DB